MLDKNLDLALIEWVEILGSERVVVSEPYISKATTNCSVETRKIPAILYPVNTEEVVEVVKIADKHQVSIYPFSTGHNWGYGSANPVKDDCVLLNLSRMNKIVDFDPESGLITLQPGVTQRQLDLFLKEHNYAYLIPVTGAGPDCSIVGNAMERGYGITPYADHFAAVMGLQAVLPSGEVYQSLLSNFGGQAIDKSFKWGMGPYVDGIFTQSNFGIVTQMTIALAPVPDKIEAFFFSVKKADELELAVKSIRQVLREIGSVTGSINLMNKHRVLSMSEPYPKDQLGPDGLIPDELLKTMMKRNQIMEWTGVGALYGNKKVIAAARSEIRRILKPVAKRLIFFTPNTVKFMHKAAKALPIIRDLHLVNVLGNLNKTMQLFAGQPSEIALPLAYWKSGIIPDNGDPMNPDLDGCGLIWYSPLLPMKPELTKQFVEMVTAICIKHKIEPLITLTSLSDRCWDSTIPILFDRGNQEDIERAKACYHELLESGRSQGFVPYRLGIQSMDLLTTEKVVPSLLLKLKSAIDPNRIISPGKYGM